MRDGHLAAQLPASADAWIVLALRPGYMTFADRRWLLPAAAGVLLSAVAVVAFHGPTLVFALALLQIALTRAISYNKALDRLGLEEICIGPSLVLVRLTRNGRNTEVILARQRLHVRLERTSSLLRSRLILEGDGGDLEIGSVLSDPERYALGCALRSLIGLPEHPPDEQLPHPRDNTGHTSRNTCSCAASEQRCDQPITSEWSLLHSRYDSGGRIRRKTFLQMCFARCRSIGWRAIVQLAGERRTGLTRLR
jgi:uncharacterized membrane protein